MDYIANSKNRKFKKQILVFLDRIQFGTGTLPFAGKVILILIGILLISLFFPWLQFEYFNKEKETYSAFSYFTGYIGYGIVLAIFIIPFFLLSHTKKERIRAHIPFRLSDTQMIVFIASMVLVGLMHLLLMVPVFAKFTDSVEIGAGSLLAISSVSCIIISAFFLSRKNKEESIEFRYIDHKEAGIPDEYAAILGKKGKKENQDEGNMVLPI